MEDRDLIINQIRQRLEILYQIVEDLENGDDPGDNYYTKAQVNALLIGKVDVVAGKGLSTNDYTNADKAAVASIADISYNLGVLESVVDGLFDPLDETIAQGGEVSSAQKADIREQKPISINGNVYYFVEDNGTSYIYCSYDDANSQLLIAAIGKSNWLANFSSKSFGGAVTGVKGNAESSYRTGNVNITKANIGLGQVDNTSDANKPMSNATKTYVDNANQAQDSLIQALQTNDAAQDNALVELYGEDANLQLQVTYAIDTGVKNIFETTATDYSTRNCDFTVNSDGSFGVHTTAATDAASNTFMIGAFVPKETGQYVITTGLSSAATGGDSSTTFCLQMRTGDGSAQGSIIARIAQTWTGTLEANTAYHLRFYFASGQTISETCQPMVKRAIIKSTSWEPYAPTNRELYEMILALNNGTRPQAQTLSINPGLVQLNLERGELNGDIDPDWQDER